MDEWRDGRDVCTLTISERIEGVAKASNADNVKGEHRHVGVQVDRLVPWKRGPDVQESRRDLRKAGHHTLQVQRTETGVLV